MSEALQILITLLLAYVAWQNYKINDASFYINKDKLRLDLFDRRYKVFDACRNFFLSCGEKGSVVRDKFFKFTLNTSDAQFLFGKEIKSYIEEICDKSVRLMELETKFSKEDLGAVERKILAEEYKTLSKWLATQSDHMSKIFSKYLHFAIDKHP